MLRYSASPCHHHHHRRGGMDWGPAAREALDLRRFSQDDITVGYGGARINQKRCSVPSSWKNVQATSRRTLAPESLFTENERSRSPLPPFLVAPAAAAAQLMPSQPPPRRKRSSVVADVGRASIAYSSSKEEEEAKKKLLLDLEEARRRRIVLVFIVIGCGILLISVLLVTVTLRLSPRIDEMGKAAASVCVGR